MQLRTLLAAAALLTTITSTPASAASIRAWDVATLTQRSTLVVEARVDAVRSEMLPDGDLRTVNTLTVLSGLKGAPASTLQVVQGSGRVGDLVKTIHGDMELAVGGRYVLFLREREGELHSTLLGWSVFRIDGTGDDATLHRNLAGLALFSPGPDGFAPATEVDIAAATPPTLGVLRRGVKASR